MTFSATSASVAFAADAEDTVETVVTSDVMSVEGYEVEETYEEEIECEVQEFVEGDDTSVELSEDDVIESMNLTNGVSDVDLGTVEDKVADPIDTGETLVADNEPLEDSLGEFVESEGVSKGEVETEFAVLRFEASQDNVTIIKGGTATVNLTYWGFYGSVKVCATKNNENVSGTIQKKSSTKFEMILSGDRVGTTKIVAKLYSSKGELLKEKTINITVTKANYITVQKTRVDLLAGKSAEIGVNFYGSTKYSISTSPKNNCEVSLQKCGWLDLAQLGYKYKLVIKGTNVGTTKITVYQKNSSDNTLDQKTITLNVSRNATVTPSSSKVSVDVGASKTISFTNKNAYGSLRYSFSLSNANCVTSWNGNNLTITGKKAGTTTVTVRLSDSRGNFLASTTVTVTVKRNPKLTPNVSTVNIIPAQKSKVNIKMSGYDGGVYAKYSSSNSSICGLSWSGSWSNNSITMTAYGYKQGSTKITIYLYDSAGNQLTTTSVTVKVTGVPSITTDSSYNVNMGAQKSFVVSVKNIASNYTLYFSKNGASFESNWMKQGNTYYCTIKGANEGSGSIKISLKSDDGVVLATKTIPVKILWVENPQVSVGTTHVSFPEDFAGKIDVNCTGTKKDFFIRATNKRYSYEPEVELKLESNSKSKAAVTVRCSSPTIARIKIEMIEKSTKVVLASNTITCDITADTSEFWNLTYGVKNYSTTIPLSTFRYMFDYEGRAEPSTYAKELYDAHRNANGVCYGFACTSMLFRGGTVTTSAFGASNIRSITNLNKFVNPTLNISAKRFVEGMYLMQFSNWFNLKYDLNEMCRLVRNGTRVQIAIFDNGGHALIGYKLDEARHRLYVADSNGKTDSSRYIQLTYTNGKYTGWSYAPLGWSGSYDDESIGYQLTSDIANMWNHRANEFYDDTLNSWLENINNTLMINSSKFSIQDVEGNVLATYANGKLSSNDEAIREIRTISYLEDPDYTLEEYSNNTIISLPRAFYVIENKDISLDTFDVKMINYDYGVSVSTEADQVAFGVDDTCDLCMTSVTLEKGESYDVTLLSSREGESDIHVEGIATAESVDLGFAMVEGQLAETNSDGVTVNLNGTADNYYEIEASATEGGSISPAGTSNVVRGSDLTYSIVADEGYFISEVLVNGIPVGAVDEYTFYSVDENSTIEARFEKSDLTVTHIDVKKDGYNVVSWNPARTSNGYEVYRKHISGDWQKIADVESDVLDFVDEEITSKFYEYSYSVKAYSFDDSGETIYGSFDTIGSKLDSSDVNLSVSKTPTKTTYIVGDNFDASGMELLLNYNDGTSEFVTDGFTVNGFDSSEKGTKNLTVMYEGLTTTFEVSIIGKADFSKIDMLLDTIRNLDSQHYTNYDEVYATYIEPFEDALDLAKTEYLSENEQIEIDALYEELVGYYNLFEIAEAYRPYFEVAGGATVLTQGGVNYIVGLQPSLTKAKFQSTYADYENVTLVFNMTTARYMGTGSTLTVKSTATGEVIAEYVIVIYGDVDGSATINGRDAAAVSNSITGVADSLTGAAKLAANVEGARATINAKDASVIRAVAGGSMTIDQSTGKGVEI